MISQSMCKSNKETISATLLLVSDFYMTFIGIRSVLFPQYKNITPLSKERKVSYSLFSVQVSTVTVQFLIFFYDYLTCKNVIFKFDKENHFWIIPDLHGHLLLLLFVPVSCSGRWWPFSQFSHSRFCFLSSLSDKTVMKQSRDGLTGVPFHLELTSFTRRDSS